MLALFNRQNIEIKDILEEAEEIYFLDEFDNALFETLSTPSDDLAKIIYKNMGGLRSNEKVLNQIKELVNSTSLKATLDRVIKKEIASTNTGVITTEEEIKAYNVIKTILAMSSKIKSPQLDRISYRDLKTMFIIIVDDNQNKQICSVIFKDNSKVIEIDKKPYKLDEVSISSITKLKKELIEKALSHLS